MYSEGNMQNPRNLPAIRRVGPEQSNMESIHPRLKRVRSESIDRDFSTFVCITYCLEMIGNPHKQDMRGATIDVKC